MIITVGQPLLLPGGLGVPKGHRLDFVHQRRHQHKKSHEGRLPTPAFMAAHQVKLLELLSGTGFPARALNLAYQISPDKSSPQGLAVMAR